MLLLIVTGLRAFQLPHAEPAVTEIARAETGPADAGPTLAPSPLLRVDTSLVLIPVTVTDTFGAPVTGLNHESFRIFEDQVEQKIAAVYTEDAPVSVGLLLDSSGSMRSKWRKATEAAAALFRTSGDQDEFFLIEFNDRAKLVLPFTPDSGEVCAQIARSKPSGRTSLIDAIYLAVAQMKHARYPRRALVIVSDGGDNWSRHSVREMKDALIESGVQVYAMGIFDPDYDHNHPVEERDGPELLDEITALSGGRDFRIDSADDLPSISERLGRQLHSQYLLGYYSTDPTRDGRYRKVQVKLTLPNASDLRTTYRRGYYSLTDPPPPSAPRPILEPQR